MNLKPELLQVMTNLGVTEAELQVLAGRMTFTVSTLEAQLKSINSQIEQLERQRMDLLTELQSGQKTMMKLIDLTPLDEPSPPAEAPSGEAPLSEPSV